MCVHMCSEHDLVHVSKEATWGTALTRETYPAVGVHRSTWAVLRLIPCPEMASNL